MRHRVLSKTRAYAQGARLRTNLRSLKENSAVWPGCSRRCLAKCPEPSQNTRLQSMQCTKLCLRTQVLQLALPAERASSRHLVHVACQRPMRVAGPPLQAHTCHTAQPSPSAPRAESGPCSVQASARLSCTSSCGGSVRALRRSARRCRAQVPALHRQLRLHWPPSILCHVPRRLRWDQCRRTGSSGRLGVRGGLHCADLQRV